MKKKRAFRFGVEEDIEWVHVQREAQIHQGEKSTAVTSWTMSGYRQSENVTVEGNTGRTYGLNLFSGRFDSRLPVHRSPDTTSLSVLPEGAVGPPRSGCGIRFDGISHTVLKMCQPALRGSSVPVLSLAEFGEGDPTVCLSIYLSVCLYVCLSLPACLSK